MSWKVLGRCSGWREGWITCNSFLNIGRRTRSVHLQHISHTICRFYFHISCSRPRLESHQLWNTFKWSCWCPSQGSVRDVSASTKWSMCESAQIVGWLFLHANVAKDGNLLEVRKDLQRNIPWYACACHWHWITALYNNARDHLKSLEGPVRCIDTETETVPVMGKKFVHYE